MKVYQKHSNITQNMHGASKIIATFGTYHQTIPQWDFSYEAEWMEIY